MKKKNYVVSKTPLRISFLGGGTDIPYFYKKFGGSTLNLAINKYVYVTVKRHSKYFIENYRLNYHESENCSKIKEIKNSIIRETIKFLKIKTPLFISIISDVPTGTGLGGSSAFTVGLIKALAKLENIKINKKKLLDIATHIELNIIKNPIGKQDHLPAVYGGMIYAKYLKSDSIKIFKIKTMSLDKKLIIVWSNVTRNANEILINQKKSLKKNIIFLNKMKKISDNFYNNYSKKKKFNVNELIKSLNDSWNLKKKLSNLISLKSAEKLIFQAQKKNIGAKILGAGGGGFILLFDQNSFKKFNLKNISFSYEKITVYNEGSKIIYEE